MPVLYSFYRFGAYSWHGGGDWPAGQLDRYICTGAMWNEHQLTNIDEGDGKCKNCKSNVNDSDYILWRCPVIDKYRCHTKLCNIDIEALPKTSRCGLPTTLQSAYTDPYWGKALEQTGDEVMHGRPTPKAAKFAQAKDMQLVSCLGEIGIQRANVNTR